MLNKTLFLVFCMLNKILFYRKSHTRNFRSPVKNVGFYGMIFIKKTESATVYFTAPTLFLEYFK